jgi:hypothetical protein
MDVLNTFRRIRSLQLVSFAYTFGENARPDMDVSQARIVDVVRFDYSHASFRETTIQSWIQDPRVMDQCWTPVSVTPGSNWMQKDIKKNFSAECESDCRVRVNWLWTGDVSGAICTGGRRRHPGPDTDPGMYPLPPATPVTDIPPLPSPLVRAEPRLHNLEHTS